MIRILMPYITVFYFSLLQSIFEIFHAKETLLNMCASDNNWGNRCVT